MRKFQRHFSRFVGGLSLHVERAMHRRESFQAGARPSFCRRALNGRSYFSPLIVTETLSADSALAALFPHTDETPQTDLTPQTHLLPQTVELPHTELFPQTELTPQTDLEAVRGAEAQMLPAPHTMPVKLALELKVATGELAAPVKVVVSASAAAMSPRP